MVAVNPNGNSADSSTDTGYRGVGSLTYQWQVSAADSDASYTNIGGATTASYNYTSAPSPTANPPTVVAVALFDATTMNISWSGATITAGGGLYYKCIENASGATQQTSASDRGYTNDTIASYNIYSDIAATGTYSTLVSNPASSPYNLAFTSLFYKVKTVSTSGFISALSTLYGFLYNSDLATAIGTINTNLNALIVSVAAMQGNTTVIGTTTTNIWTLINSVFGVNALNNLISLILVLVVILLAFWRKDVFFYIMAFIVCLGYGLAFYPAIHTPLGFMISAVVMGIGVYSLTLGVYNLVKGKSA